jgi:hypothetical protein
MFGPQHVRRADHGNVHRIADPAREGGLGGLLFSDVADAPDGSRSVVAN